MGEVKGRGEWMAGAGVGEDSAEVARCVAKSNSWLLPPAALLPL